MANNIIAWKSIFRKFFVPKKGLFEKKVDPQKLVEVGDLMTEPPIVLSKEETCKKWNINPERQTIAMLPGSRLWEIKYMLPFYAKVGKLIKEKMDLG